MSQSTAPIIHFNENVKNVNYMQQDLANHRFISCNFLNCDFQQCNLSSSDLVDCRFDNCCLSMVDIKGCGFRNAVFAGCTMIGIDFSKCNKVMFSFEFTDCLLDYCTFFGMNLTSTQIRNCSLKEADFEGVDLTEVNFDNCNLEGTKFLDAILEKADFRTARNFEIDVARNRVKNAKFSSLNLSGLLTRYKLDIEEEGLSIRQKENFQST